LTGHKFQHISFDSNLCIMKRDSKQWQITYRKKLLWKQIAKISSASLLSSIFSSLYVPSFPISTFSNNGLYIYYILYVSLIKNVVNRLTNNISGRCLMPAASSSKILHWLSSSPRYTVQIVKWIKKKLWSWAKVPNKQAKNLPENSGVASLGAEEWANSKTQLFRGWILIFKCSVSSRRTTRSHQHLRFWQEKTEILS
jgi:hypothetical protein